MNTENFVDSTIQHQLGAEFKDTKSSFLMRLFTMLYCLEVRKQFEHSKQFNGREKDYETTESLKFMPQL
jgi:hypothetical protein